MSAATNALYSRRYEIGRELSEQEKYIAADLASIEAKQERVAVMRKELVEIDLAIKLLEQKAQIEP